MKIIIRGIEHEVENELDAYRLVCDGKSPQELSDWLDETEGKLEISLKQADAIFKLLNRIL